MMHFHTYEWLPGNFHLYHCWEGKIGTHESKGVEIIGFDPATGTYPFHFFDSDGWARIYEGRVNGHLWTLSGTRERSTTVFSPDGLTMTTHWDRSPDGQVWEPLCDITANKVSNREAAFAVLQREPGLSE